MKTCVTLFSAVILSTVSTAFSGKVEVSVQPKKISGKYAPKHVAAIWVVNDKGEHIKTLAVHGKKRKKRLAKWMIESKKSHVDVVSEATRKSFMPFSVSWDCLDAKGKEVPDGKYSIMIEYTCTNKPGPITPANHIQFTKGPKAAKLTPKNLENFTDIKLTYTP